TAAATPRSDPLSLHDALPIWYQATVILIGRNERKLEAVHAEIGASGAPEASIAVLDLERALAADYDRVADAVLERYGRLDGLLRSEERRVGKECEAGWLAEAW